MKNGRKKDQKDRREKNKSAEDLSSDLNPSEGYRITVEDTLIGYDGHEEQLNMDYLSDEEKLRSGHSGADDNS